MIETFTCFTKLTEDEAKMNAETLITYLNNKLEKDTQFNLKIIDIAKSEGGVILEFEQET